MALALAGSFGFYGLLRKTVGADALVGLTVETTLLSPIALAYLGYEMAQGHAMFAAGSLRTDVLLMLAGVVTAVPLLWFAAAARRLRYTTVGFIQYLAPTGHFLLAVLAYGEPFATAHIVTFAFIWAGLLIYSIDAVMSTRPVPVAALPE